MATPPQYIIISDYWKFGEREKHLHVLKKWKKKNTTLLERFQNPIENRRRQHYCNVWTKTLQDSSMNGSNRRFTIMLQSDVIINCYYFWRKVEDTKEEIRSCISNESQWIGQKKKDKRTHNDLQKGVNRN